MDWILALFGAGVLCTLLGITLGLTLLASRSLQAMVRPKVCPHTHTHTSYLTATTRCRQCGDILGQD